MINTSIVLFNHSFSEIAPLVQSLLASGVISECFILDNSPTPSPEFKSLAVTYIFNNNNPGYGAAHNIAIRKTIEQGIPYHLVINPDIEIRSSDLEIIESFMNLNTKTGHLMPKVLYPDGKIQYLCKLLPTPFDLIFRRFLPAKWTESRMEKFEMRKTGYNKLMQVPYLSGCFMFLRTEALKEIGLFDERFFMYPEDIDLTRRIHRKYQTVFYPDVSIVHHHAQSSYLNLKMLRIHITNMILYFNKWGWIFDKERRKINNEILKQFS